MTEIDDNVRPNRYEYGVYSIEIPAFNILSQFSTKLAFSAKY